MRQALLSASIVVGTGVALVSGGAFSVFNDSGQVDGSFATGTVAITLGSTTLPVNATCLSSFTGTTANMGSVNNSACTSVVAVTNSGSLPLRLNTASSTVTDVVSATAADGAACFTSALGSLGGVLLPGQSFDVQVTTSINPDDACQGATDALSVTLVADESLPGA